MVYLCEDQTIYIDESLCLLIPNINYATELYHVIDFNRASFRQFMAWPDLVIQESDTVNFLNSCLLAHQRDESKTYIILFDGVVVGLLSFNQVDKQNKTAYLGYWLDNRMQGKGIITTSVKALVKYYAQHNIIKRFVIKCSVHNIKSNNVAKRCGFLYEGTLRQAEYLNGTFYDQNMFSFISEYLCIQ